MTRKLAAPTATATETTALATVETPNLPTVASTTSVTRDVLDGLDLGDADDGLGELRPEELTVATVALNAKRTDVNGRQIGADMLFNTVDETARESINATLLYRELTNSYTRYDETEQRTHVLCRSEDLVTGTMADGHTRKCERCPDAEWTTDVDTKKRRPPNCALTHSVLALDRDLQQLFIIRFRKTSEPVFRAHLKKHHIGRRVQHGKISNYPLYTWAVRISGKMASAKATYALPVIEAFGVLPPEEIKMCAETVSAHKGQMRGWLESAEAADVDAHASDADDSAGGDTSFATDKFVDAPGGTSDFVE